jgi:hypothetical protein
MKVFGKFTALALAMVSTVLFVAGVVSASAQSGTRHVARVAAIRSEPPGPARASARAPHLALGFNVANLSSHPIKLRNVHGNAKFDGRTPDGSILGAKSAELQFFNVQARTLGVAMAFANYAILGDNGQQIGTVEVVIQVVDTLFGFERRNIACRPSLGSCMVSPRGDVITLLDHAVPPPRGERNVFLVYNLSSHPIKLINVTFNDNIKPHPERPAIGSILGPKSVYQRFQVFPGLLVEAGVNGHYVGLGDHGQEIATIKIHMVADVANQRAGCFTPGGHALCGPSPAEDVIFVHSVH